MTPAVAMHRLVVELGYRGAAGADIAAALFQVIFELGDYRVLANLLRAFDLSEDRIFDVFQAWSEDLGRDPGEAWIAVWAPALGEERERGG